MPHARLSRLADDGRALCGQLVHQIERHNRRQAQHVAVAEFLGNIGKAAHLLDVLLRRERPTKTLSESHYHQLVPWACTPRTRLQPCQCSSGVPWAACSSSRPQAHTIRQIRVPQRSFESLRKHCSIKQTTNASLAAHTNEHVFHIIVIPPRQCDKRRTSRISVWSFPKKNKNNNNNNNKTVLLRGFQRSRASMSRSMVVWLTRRGNPGGGKSLATGAV